MDRGKCWLHKDVVYQKMIHMTQFGLVDRDANAHGLCFNPIKDVRRSSLIHLIRKTTLAACVSILDACRCSLRMNAANSVHAKHPHSPFCPPASLL